MRTAENAPLRRLLDRIDTAGGPGPRPLMVALDGGSGAGKSTLAAALAAVRPTAVVAGDDFYAGGSAARWDAMTAAEKAAHCIDWRRQVPVLAALARGETASWHPYDWDADGWDTDEGRRAADPVHCAPAGIVVLDGVYSARPELAALFDLRVLLAVPPATRRTRLTAREGADFAPRWYARWAEAEQHYFTRTMPPDHFDLVLETDA